MSTTSRHPHRFGRHLGMDTDDVVGRSRTHAVDGGNSLLQRLVRTDATFHAAVARLTLGLVMLPHALQKGLGWFGGHGFRGTYEGFTARMGIPGPIAFLAILAELVGALALVTGVLTRVAALAIMGVMLGAIVFAHLPNGFFMNWTGTQAGEGFEYHLLAIGLALVVLLAGGGQASIDRALMKRRPAEGGSVGEVLTRA
jgi:putative oxidoreductase